MATYSESTVPPRDRIVFIILLCLQLLINSSASFSWSSLSSAHRSRRHDVSQTKTRLLEQQQQQQQQQLSNDGSGGGVYPLQVFYDGCSCEIQVRPDETILAALERCGVTDRLAISLPYDCRQGNCLTCAGRLLKSDDNTVSSLSDAAIKIGENGLSPNMARQVQDAGFVLTCSSYVTGPGLHIELGQNNDAWQQLWVQNLEGDEVRSIGRAAAARAMRSRAEKHTAKWTAETEKVLQRQQTLDNTSSNPRGDLP